MQMLLPAAIFLLMVSIGMSLDLSTLWANWRRVSASLWVRLLLATFIFPPLIALALAAVFPITLPDFAALFVVAVVPGAPLMTRNIAKKGFDMHLAANYQLWGALLTPVMVPLLIAAGGKLYHRDIWIDPLVLLSEIARKQFLPLLVGVAMMRFFPELSKKLGRWFNVGGNAVLTLVIVVMLYKLGPALGSVSLWVPVCALLLAVGCMASIRILGIPDPAMMHTFAICNANRYVGLAILITGQQLHAAKALPALACYAIAAAISMAVYVKRAKAT